MTTTSPLANGSNNSLVETTLDVAGAVALANAEATPATSSVDAPDVHEYQVLVEELDGALAEAGAEVPESRQEVIVDVSCSQILTV